MKNLLLTILLIPFSLITTYGQKPCDIRNHYEDFISVRKIKYIGEDFLLTQIVEPQKKNCISSLVSNNPKFLDYLLTHFSANTHQAELLASNDSTTLKTNYFIDLKKDSLYNAVMNELVNKTVDHSIPKDTVTIDKLLNVAVKYFSITKLNEEGHYVGKVCVGLNDIKKTETDRKPFIEAFAFSSILKHYRGEEFSMYDEFVKAIKELYKVNLGIDKNEKLLRAQGAMFLLMRNNENLRQMLKSEYEKQKDYLPFILIYP